MKKIKFNWKCIYCGKRNIEDTPFMFDIPKQYEAHWPCSGCGDVTRIEIKLTTDLPRKIGLNK